MAPPRPETKMINTSDSQGIIYIKKTKSEEKGRLVVIFGRGGFKKAVLRNKVKRWIRVIMNGLNPKPTTMVIVKVSKTILSKSFQEIKREFILKLKK